MLVVLLTNQKDYELSTIKHVDIIGIVIQIYAFAISNAAKPPHVISSVAKPLPRHFERSEAPPPSFRPEGHEVARSGEI